MVLRGGAVDLFADDELEEPGIEDSVGGRALVFYTAILGIER